MRRLSFPCALRARISLGRWACLSRHCTCLSCSWHHISASDSGLLARTASQLIIPLVQLHLEAYAFGIPAPMQ